MIDRRAGGAPPKVPFRRFPSWLRLRADFGRRLCAFDDTKRNRELLEAVERPLTPMFPKEELDV